MKTKIAANRMLGGTMSLGILLLAQSALSQSALKFTAANATDEGNILLKWSSVSNEIYQIQEADALINTNGGLPTWNLLYDGYPSQGTNTLWLDAGNYNLVPQIPNPKNRPMRFYRIMDEGSDSLASDEPVVSISSPSNNTSASGALTVTVVAATDQPVISGTKLYVDGQEMRPADSVTNWSSGSTNYQAASFFLNTCEWGNETHILFATAKSQSGYGDDMGSGAIMTGHGVSPFVPVLFSNLITRISFSQPFFDPASSQTQQVRAVFAANCDWTLTIRDVFSNEVRTASGSGPSMLFNWDGNGDGGTNLPNGVYFYYISAQTNGESEEVEGGGSVGGGISPPLPDSLELWAAAPDSESAVPFALYPPGFDTNGFTIFSASPLEMSALSPSVSSSFSGGFFSADSGGGSSQGAQASPATPNRPPPSPTRGVAGTFGAAWETYTSNGTNGISIFQLPDGSGITGRYIQFAPSGATSQTAPALPQAGDEANNFISEMQIFGWRCNFREGDSSLNMNDLKGSGTLLNNVELGILCCHGNYGTSQDYAAGLCKQMYFPIGNQWLRLSSMNLGGSDPTNGLKWFGLLACNSLNQANWSSMQSHGIKPYNGYLHLLLGTDSLSYDTGNVLKYWAQYMNYGNKSAWSSGGATPMKIKDAWNQAGVDAYKNSGISGVVKFAVAGDSACMDDYVQSGYNSSPQGSWVYATPVQVYP